MTSTVPQPIFGDRTPIFPNRQAGIENQNAQDGVAFVYHCVVATIRWYDA